MGRDDRAEQTPQGEGNTAATKAASRKLQLGGDDNDLMTIEERHEEDVSFHSSSLGESSQQNPNPFRESRQQEMISSPSQVETEVTVKKQLFPSDRRSGILDRFRYSHSSKKVTSSTKLGSHNPFTLLDQSQKFVSGTGSENIKSSALEDNIEDDADVCLQENFMLPRSDSILIDSDQGDDLDSQTSVAESTAPGGEGASRSGSFSYMTSKDFITAHPCTLGQSSSAESWPTALHRSHSVSESMLQPERVRRTSSQLEDFERNTPSVNRRGSDVTSTTNSKV